MKIEKFIEFSENVDIHLSSEDIMLIFDSDPDSLPQILSCLNSVACFLKGVSGKKIKKMEPGQRKVIVEFLTEQAARYGGL